ncbi:hypothetical protein D8Y20_05695 [Mariprofundus sp. EBB-1]|uniref:glycine zipper family protein n=1 Tax=Mariprofundus sp. EBB-1 TaxID=2650971 RepID=UPI000EF1DE4E|nr:glycine zipper family protein [Mariprofundus sp. EBB-1]RLL52998.1 hypothetical protein D8Y20_05695 [Mariprofundus sp. EBB-1]
MKRYLSIVAIGLLASCATPYQERSATQGATVGAVAGAVIGAQSDQFVEGAIIGGVLGGLAGAMLADDRDDRIHESAPRYHRSNCSRGDIYFQRARHQRRLDRRITLMRQGIAYCPNNPAAHNDLGVALMLWGNNNGARMHFQQALRFDSQYYPARHNLQRMRRYHAPARYQQPDMRPAQRERVEERHERRRDDRQRYNYRQQRQDAERNHSYTRPQSNRDRQNNYYQQQKQNAERNSDHARPQSNRDRQNNDYRQDEEDGDHNRHSRDRRDD